MKENSKIQDAARFIKDFGSHTTKLQKAAAVASGVLIPASFAVPEAVGAIMFTAGAFIATVGAHGTAENTANSVNSVQTKGDASHNNA